MSAAAPPPPPVAVELFGAGIDRAVRYAELLCTDGVARGLVGPREAERIWTRHLVNSALLAPLVPEQAAVVDVGSGAGLPGIPLAIARPDLSVTLVEPMLRRVRFLEDCAATLSLPTTIRRARGEELAAGSADVVVARAVAPLARLVPTVLHVLRPDGTLLAMKGRSAEAEIEAMAPILRQWPGLHIGLEVVQRDSEVARVVRVTMPARVGSR